MISSKKQRVLFNRTSVSAFNRYPILKAAYAAGRGKIGFIGDSKTMGWIALNGVDNNGCYAVSPAKTVIADLVAAGVTAIDGYFGGTKAGVVANQLLYDPRISCSNTTNWVAGGVVGYDGGALVNSVDTVAMTLTPGFQYDRVRVGYVQAASAGVFTVKQGGSTIITATETNASNGFTTQTASVALSSTPLDVARVSGTIYATPFLEVWNSTVPHVQIYQMGVQGRQVANWINGSLPWEAPAGLSVLDCDLYIVELGANDANAGVSAATYETNLTTLVTTLKGYGADVQLVATTRAGGTAAAYDIPAGYLTAIANVIAAQSLPPMINLYALSTPFTASNYADAVLHPKAAYNVTIGHTLSSALLS